MIADEFGTIKEGWDLDDELFGNSSDGDTQSKPGGNATAGDMSAKCSLCHQISSLSDLADEISMPADDNKSECYRMILESEIVSIEGVSEIPQLHSKDIDQVPCCASGVRSIESVIPMPHPKAVVSLVSPYKLIIVSKEFGSLFGYSVENEICDRAVKILQGPRTDPTLLASSIKGAALASTRISSLVLYDRAGRDIELDITFSPFLSGDAAGLVGCLMELSLVPGGS
jgi:hypothetical protein